MNTPATIDELARAVEQTRDQGKGIQMEIASAQERLSDAKTNVAMADHTVADLENQLKGWKRFRAFQAKRVEIFENRVRIGRQEIRAIEDYESDLPD